jgi:CheY-like chemotaxis protein
MAGSLESLERVALLLMSARVLQGERRTPGEYAHIARRRACGTLIFCTIRTDRDGIGPATSAENMMENEIRQPESAAPRSVARVLIVDDEESIRRLVSKWTDISGYEVKAASSAEAALLMMHAWTADILVCDIRMPRYSGVWLIEHLRTLYPGTAIIISTGYGEVDPALMLRAKITGILAKPYDRATLVASLERAMESRRTSEPPVH